MCKTRVQTNHLSFHVKINRSFRKIKRKRREKRDKLMAETSYLYIFVKSGPILRHFDFFELNRYFDFGMSSIIDKWAQKPSPTPITARAAPTQVRHDCNRRPPAPASPSFPTRCARGPHCAVASGLCASRLHDPPASLQSRPPYRRTCRVTQLAAHAPGPLLRNALRSRISSQRARSHPR